MSDINRLIFAFILGVIEGLTEFFPISSTGHLILINSFFIRYIDDTTKNFMVIVQLGSILSVVVEFWDRLYKMSCSCISKLFFLSKNTKKNLCCWHILIGTFPAILLGTFLDERFRHNICDVFYIIYGLIFGGVFLLVSELCWQMKSEKKLIDINNISYFQAFLIGCFQCLAFFPGFSRSGSTIGGGLLIGMTRISAVEFSFFLAIPIILAATIFTVYRYGCFMCVMDIILLLIGFCTSFFVSIVSIKWFLKIIRDISLIPFILYRFFLAGYIFWSVVS